MLSIHGLSKNFGDTVALSGVSFSAERGQIVGLLGPNGAGKTTLMRIIAGTLCPTGGGAALDGMDVTSKSLEVRKRLGYLPEHNGLYLEMRVGEYLCHRASLKNLGGKAKRLEVERVLGACGLTAIRRRVIGQLSKGYRQRVGLAAAILGDPELIILDEPTVGLDPLQMREIHELIRSIGRERTVLFSTHILSEAEALCDRIVIISDGRKLLDASTEELKQHAFGTWIEIETAGPAEPALEAIRSVKGVEAEALEQDGLVRLRVKSSDGGFDMAKRSEIAAALVRSNTAILGLSLKTPRLDDIFVSIAGDGGAA